MRRYICIWLFRTTAIMWLSCKVKIYSIFIILCNLVNCNMIRNRTIELWVNVKQTCWSRSTRLVYNVVPFRLLIASYILVTLTRTVFPSELGFKAARVLVFEDSIFWKRVNGVDECVKRVVIKCRDAYMGIWGVVSFCCEML